MYVHKDIIHNYASMISSQEAPKEIPKARSIDDALGLMADVKVGIVVRGVPPHSGNPVPTLYDSLLMLQLVRSDPSYLVGARWTLQYASKLSRVRRESAQGRRETLYAYAVPLDRIVDLPNSEKRDKILRDLDAEAQRMDKEVEKYWRVRRRVGERSSEISAKNRAA